MCVGVRLEGLAQALLGLLPLARCDLVFGDRDGGVDLILIARGRVERHAREARRVRERALHLGEHGAREQALGVIMTERVLPRLLVIPARERRSKRRRGRIAPLRVGVAGVDDKNTPDSSERDEGHQRDVNP